MNEITVLCFNDDEGNAVEWLVTPTEDGYLVDGTEGDLSNGYWSCIAAIKGYIISCGYELI